MTFVDFSRDMSESALKEVIEIAYKGEMGFPPFP